MLTDFLKENIYIVVFESNNIKYANNERLDISFLVGFFLGLFFLDLDLGPYVVRCLQT